MFTWIYRKQHHRCTLFPILNVYSSFSSLWLLGDCCPRHESPTLICLYSTPPTTDHHGPACQMAHESLQSQLSFPFSSRIPSQWTSNIDNRSLIALFRARFEPPAESISHTSKSDNGSDAQQLYSTSVQLASKQYAYDRDICANFHLFR